MPIYEYGCEACGNEFELMQRIGADAPPCPSCGGGVQKRVSRTSFQLKGGGWYKDGYSGKSNQKGDSGGGSSSASVPAKSESTAESKPAKAESSSTPASST